jgi:hypothetical protein
LHAKSLINIAYPIHKCHVSSLLRVVAKSA